MPLSSGTRLGPYEITEPLGAGGMGEVYRARDLKLGRDVAIKVLPTALANDTGYITRFQREAQVLASLNHPKIAAIYGLEENAIVMELVEGSDLRGPLPLNAALEMARQIVEALGAAHEKGIVHRDLKPANIKITPEGIVKVLDFGLAKGVEQIPAPGDPENSPTVTFGATVAGTIMGTAAYMAPEQARGQAVDCRADIWAFGVVLYEMLTGQRIFRGGSTSDVLAAVLTKEPDWSALPVATPARVRELLRFCLAKDRKLRLQAIGDAQIFLNAPVEEAVAIPRRQILPWAAAGFLALSLIAMIGLWAPWRAPLAVADRPLLQLDLDAGPDEASQPAVSPDGMRIVFVANGHLAMRRLDQAKITWLAGTEGASYPFFSPTGQWVAFFAGEKLRKIAVEGGAPVALCDASNGRGGSWVDDGSIVAVLNARGGLSLVPAAGGTPRPLTNLDAERAGVVSHCWPQVLPGGEGVLFAATTGLSQRSLQVISLNSGKLKTLVENSTHGRYLGSGYLVYYQHGTLFAAPMDVGRLELTGPEVPLVDGVSYDAATGRADFDLSRSGTLVYRRGTAEANRIPSWLYSSGKVERLALKPGNYRTPRLSPDGKRLALAVTQEGHQNLWVYDLSRETMTRLTFDAVPEYSPIWTPDGKFLAFRSVDTLAWTRSDGSGKVERLAEANRRANPWSFSPDGKWLAFSQRDPQGGFHLWIVAVERAPGALRLGQPQPFLRQAGDQHEAVISPDGRWMAYMSDESGRFEIYVVPFLRQGLARGGKWQVSNGGGLHPIWSHKGGELFYGSLDHRILTAAYTAKGDLFLAEKPRIWSDTRLPDTGTSPFFDVAPDDKRVVTQVDAEDAKPETHLRVLLNVDSELRRRTSSGGK